MGEPANPPICRFYRLIDGAPEPTRADRTADGTLPINAVRYCEPIASASGFGWYLYPPLNFSLIWDGTEIAWAQGGSSKYSSVRGVQYPGFRDAFAALAPEALKELAPPFLVQGSHPGTVQIWSGYLARTAPGWALLSRRTANLQRTQPFENFEGIFETETWFGPLFTNIRLLRTNSPIEFHMRRPLFQVQPVMRACYRDPSYEVLGSGDLDAEDWRRFEATILPNTDRMRRPGHYAVETRKRLRGE
jgi:hypothetical protein